MNFPVTIVGVRHYVPDCEVFIQTLRDGQEVDLLFERGNLEDRYAIAAYVDGRKVGYVSAIEARIIRRALPDEEHTSATVWHGTYAERHHAFSVRVTLSDATLDLPEPSFDLGPVAGIPLPDVPSSLRLPRIRLDEELTTWIDLWNESADPALLVGLSVIADHLRQILGTSLTGEDERLFFSATYHLSWLVDAAAAEDLHFDADLEQLMDLHQHIAGSLADAEATFLREKEQVAAAAAPQMREYDALLASGLHTAEELFQLHDVWLRRHVPQLYPHLQDTALFARRLHYELYPLSALYAIYYHLLCRERMEALCKRPKRESKGIYATFRYWGGPSVGEMRAAKEAMLRAAQDRRTMYAGLVTIIREQQRSRVIASDLGVLKVFVANLSDFLDIPLSYDSFQKAWRKQHHTRKE